MIQDNQILRAKVPEPRAEAPYVVCSEPDHRPRLLRWLLPMACSSAVPLDGMQQAELKLIAYH